MGDSRRIRQQRLDAGEETARLKFLKPEFPRGKGMQVVMPPHQAGGRGGRANYAVPRPPPPAQQQQAQSWYGGCKGGKDRGYYGGKNYAQATVGSGEVGYAPRYATVPQQQHAQYAQKRPYQHGYGGGGGYSGGGGYGKGHGKS